MEKSLFNKQALFKAHLEALNIFRTETAGLPVYSATLHNSQSDINEVEETEMDIRFKTIPEVCISQGKLGEFQMQQHG